MSLRQCDPCPTTYSVAKVEQHGATKREIHLALVKPSCAPCLADSHKNLYTEQQVRLDQVMEVLDKNRLNQDLVVFVNYSKDRREVFRVHLSKMVSKSGYFFDSICNLRASFDHRRSVIEICNPEISPEIFASILDLIYYKSVISCDDGLKTIRRAAEVLDIEEIVLAIDELCQCPADQQHRDNGRKSKCHPNDTRNSNNNNIHAIHGSSRHGCDDDVKRRFHNEGGGDRGGGEGKGGDMGDFQSFQSAFCGRRPCAPTAPLPCRTPIGQDDKYQQTIADAERFGCRPIRDDHLQNVSHFPVRLKDSSLSSPFPSLDDAPLENPFASLFDAMESGSNRRFHVAYNDVMSSFFALSATEEFLKCELEQVLFILASDLIRVPDEMFVFRAAMRWIYYDQKSRLKHAAEVLENIRFCHMTWKQLQDVKDVELMSQCKQLWEMLSKAFTFHNLGMTRATKLGFCLPRRRRYYGNTSNFDVNTCCP